MIGYSTGFISQVKSARMNEQVRKIALLAIKDSIPVKDIADHMGVSRTAIYNWFTGKNEPREQYIQVLKDYVTRRTAV